MNIWIEFVLVLASLLVKMVAMILAMPFIAVGALSLGLILGMQSANSDREPFSYAL